MRAAWAQHDTFFILHTCKHACACQIDDIKPTVYSSHVRTRCVHVRNAHAEFGLHVHANCKPMTAE